MTGRPTLVAVTPAHNEASHIAALIESVLAQTVRPAVWVIVDDASVDETGSIIDEYSKAHSFIRVVHRERSSSRKLSSKADAVNHAYEIAKEHGGEFGFVVSIDADVQLPANALAFLLDKFDADPRLGVAGGLYEHPIDGRMQVNRTGPVHVPGPLQMFRREVFEAIDGYRPLPYGGLDTVSTAHARMLGWRTTAFDDLKISHRRRVGTGGGRHPIAVEFDLGVRDYSLGTGLLFEIAKCARRLGDKPRVVGAVVRLAGYLSFAIRRRPRSLPDDLAKFIRREQYKRMAPRFTRSMAQNSHLRSSFQVQ